MYRFGVSVPRRLISKFDSLIKREGYKNRSEAIRDLIRDALVRDRWSANDQVVGTVTIVYDHHTRELSSRLTELQHNHGPSVLSTTHVHLDHDNCVEVLIIRGKGRDVQRFADEIIGTRGVKHGKLVATTTGSGLT